MRCVDGAGGLDVHAVPLAFGIRCGDRTPSLRHEEQYKTGGDEKTNTLFANLVARSFFARDSARARALRAKLSTATDRRSDSYPYLAPNKTLRSTFDLAVLLGPPLWSSTQGNPCEVHSLMII